MNKGYGRWTAKKEQWREVTAVVEGFAHPQHADALCRDLGEAIGEKLTITELERLGEFLRAFAQSARTAKR